MNQNTFDFACIGISYKEADTQTRGQFSLSEGVIDQLLEEALRCGISNMLVLSTCNRTELYSFDASLLQLKELWMAFTTGHRGQLEQLAYQHVGEEALHHLFRVGTGLESQILGDFEIISQIKKSFYVSKAKHLADGQMERLINSVIQASKQVKTETEISSGATSVAFAAVQYILQNYAPDDSRTIVLYGTGKIGRNTCENLIKHRPKDRIILLNRTLEKAAKLAQKHTLEIRPVEQLQETLQEAHILIVATGAPEPTIRPEHLENDHKLLVLDLSIPANASPEIAELPHVERIDVDQLSKITEANRAERYKHLPQAENIVEASFQDFNIWLKQRKFAPYLKNIKQMIMEHLETHDPTSGKEEEQKEFLAQKITGNVAAYLKKSPHKTEELYNILQSIFQLDYHE
ncbi:MAG: glutamyl-tRNA reductase [Flavobacteriaceae bacterium]